MSKTASSADDQDGKPIVIMIAFPASGHTQGTVQISEHLVSQGYKVYHIGGTDFKEQIQKGGANFIENDYDLQPGFQSIVGKAGPEVFHATLKHLFLDVTPKAYGLLKNTLEMVKERHPLQEVVIWHEAMAGGLLPFYYGAPLPKGYEKLPRVVNFQSSINTDRSDEVFPFGFGRPPVLNNEERAQCKEAWKAFFTFLSPVTDYANIIYKALGATQEMDDNLFCRVMNIGDVTIFPYSASLEFPRSDLRFNAQFIGTFPRPIKPAKTSPSWWPEIETNGALPANSPSKKKLIFVSQGTAHRDYSDLVIPTLTVLGGRTNLIVVVALGAKEARLPDGLIIPDNARVTDYFPYENVLQYADVFVSNAGFGGFLHGITSGVPMVVAGMDADKADVCQRAEHAGMAVNLNTQRPTKEAVGAAVDTVLAEPRYKSRAVELQEENEALQAFQTVEKIILGAGD